MDIATTQYAVAAIGGIAGGGLVSYGLGAVGMPGPEGPDAPRWDPKCRWCPAFAGLAAAVIIWAFIGRGADATGGQLPVVGLSLVSGIFGGTVWNIVAGFFTAPRA